MNRSYTIYFQIPALPNLNSQKYIERYGNQVRQSIADSQRGLLQHFLSLGNTNGLTLSLRYFYDPNNSKEERLKIYLIFNYFHNSSQQINRFREEIISFIEISNLSVFYNFDLSPGLNQNLGWVNHIGETLKPEYFNSQGYYVPDLFEAKKNNNMLNVCDILNRLNEKFLLEITLQICQNSEDRSELSKALAQMIPQLQQVTSHRRDIFFDRALSIYQHYQTTYLHSNLFKYSIKALAETRSTIRPVLMELVSSATEAKSHGEQDHVEIVSRDVDTQKFLKSLNATENVEICTVVERQGWQGNFGDKSIRQPVKPKISNDELGDGSTDIYLKPFTSYLADFNNAALPPSSRGEIVRSSPSAITQSFNSSGKSALAQIKDLKPLHRYATLEEISGFFRIVIPGNIPVPGIPQEQPPLIKPNAEEIFRKYSSAITKNPDQYIVGMAADDGRIVYSSWDNDPHRLVAGRPGYGKSNFLHWIIFQFLYANPKRKVYIADFGGADFQYLEDMNLNIEIVINSKDCKELVEKIHQEYEERLSLMRHYKVNNIKKLQAKGVEIDRMLWIIDEAAAIARADKELKKAIEQRLEEYVLQGRKFGIHVIYCTQFPTAEVVSRQVRENCGEKVVFRLSPDATDTVLGYRLGDDIASAPKGRAFVEGQDGGQYVNTPEIILPEETIVPISRTIWRYLYSRF
jgi:hypothetical protein